MRTPRLTALAITAAIALAACGGGADPPADVAVEITDFDYLPPTVEVGAGTEVTVANRDTFAHTVTAGEPRAATGAFGAVLGDLGEMNARGTEVTIIVPDEPGTYAYFCRFHPSMRGEIVVTG